MQPFEGGSQIGSDPSNFTDTRSPRPIIGACLVSLSGWGVLHAEKDGPTEMSQHPTLSRVRSIPSKIMRYSKTVQVYTTHFNRSTHILICG